MLWIVVVAVVLVVLPGRVAAQDSSSVSGIITYNERVALPPTLW
ncbi:YbaY family lipoprotein [Candidatus Chloroploca mongolica]|nr:YbaY family lipoprotein [Candidatus Chloroploca mongolica]